MFLVVYLYILDIWYLRQNKMMTKLFGKPILLVVEFKYLAVTLDSKLLFKTHV